MRKAHEKGQRRRIASATINMGQGERRGNFSTKSANIHRFAIFPPLSIQGQFALGHKMTIIFQQGAHSSVDQYPMTELFSNREIGGRVSPSTWRPLIKGLKSMLSPKNKNKPVVTAFPPFIPCSPPFFGKINCFQSIKGNKKIMENEAEVGGVRCWVKIHCKGKHK